MISPVDLARSFAAFDAHSAATPASSSHALPPPASPAPEVDASPTADRVSISAEGVRQLQRATQREEAQAALRQAVGEDAELAARIAHDTAYRREVILVPPAAYGDLAPSLSVRGISPASATASLEKAQSELDQARLARIALYEYETARGTPPAEIFDRLAQLDASRPHDQPFAVAF